MAIRLVDPATGATLSRVGDSELRSHERAFPVVRGIPRLCPEDNYARNFGLQWNKFAATQIDKARGEVGPSEQRLFAETAWKAEDLEGLDILEVGSGAGRFSRPILERTKANLWSVDFSDAVDANMATNGAIAPDRFHLFQASIYDLPFAPDSFDKVLCLGVLQHTPDFAKSVRALVQAAKPGGEIVVDFYAIKGFWTKIHAKYLLRPLTKQMSHDRLLSLIDKNADWMIALSDRLQRMRLGALNRFLPICDIRGTLPQGMPPEQLREWVVLDTFDMFSPEYDNPQRIETVEKMFRDAGAEVTFSGYVPLGNSSAPVIRAIKSGG